MKKIDVTICLGTTCFVMGSSALESFARELPDEIRPRVNIRYSACLGECDHSQYGKAPYALVNGELITSVTRENLLDRIIREIRENK